jgi:hypothetical protein
MNGVGLGREDALRFRFGNPGREDLMCDGNMFGDIRDHRDALLEVFMQQIRA